MEGDSVRTEETNVLASPGFDLGGTQVSVHRVESITPTIDNRWKSLDLARGIAVLGILLANIHAFATAATQQMFGAAARPTEGIDRIMQMLGFAFVNGKFRSMLAILFGAGLYLQFEKRKKLEGNWPGGYLKRTLFLLLFGLVHGFLLWYGDILSGYAMTAFAVCLFATAQERTRRIAFWISVGLAIGAGLLMVFGTLLSQTMHGQQNQLFLNIGNEAEIFSHGSYGQQLVYRVIVYGSLLLSYLLLLPEFFALFLIGFGLAQRGFFQSSTSSEDLGKLLKIGLGIGLPLSMLIWLGWNAKDTTALAIIPEAFTGPLLAMGYLGLVVAWSRTEFLKGVQRACENVGRMALTNYLLQTVICTTIFYSWGFGYFEQLNSVGQLCVVLGVWVVNLIGSAIYLRYYSMGPVEWLWRCLTEGRKFPIRRQRQGV